MSNVQMQLFILPYAGGSIAAFKKLTDFIDNRVETITVEYPGRGTRAQEPLKQSINDLLDDAISYCQERRNPQIPFAIMGYSMGSILAYEIIKHNMIEGELKHIFISAEISPKYRSLELSKIDDLTDEGILDRARRLGGLDERILLNKRFVDIYITPMLSDYRNFFGYRYVESREKIRTDTTFFYCKNDTPKEDVEKWRELIGGKNQFYEYGTNHFFINQYYKEMAKVINETLCR